MAFLGPKFRAPMERWWAFGALRIGAGAPENAVFDRPGSFRAPHMYFGDVAL
jgi:hypothetical protein